MSRFEALPANDDVVAWNAFFDDVDVALLDGGLERDEATDLARLWHRLNPICNTWLSRLNKQIEQTSQFDRTLRKLWRRGISLVGRLRELAAEAFAGSPEFPAIVRTGQ